MDALGLVVHDQQTFLAKAVSRGMEEGLFTRDRADEIIRVSVAMANKYVLEKQVDFRSQDELAEVQETILMLAGIGLEIKSGGDLDEGVQLLVEASPVDLFRVAYTRVARLRHEWRKLLEGHDIRIFVSAEEYECLSDFSCQRLSELSIYSDTELETIQSLKLEDRLFAHLGILEYYESELERYQFIRRLKELLPFDLLSKSSSIFAENLAEVDSVREALVNTLIITGQVNRQPALSVSLSEIRRFLTDVELSEMSDVMPEEIEQALVDLIADLGEGLDEHEATLFAREMIRMGQQFVETILNEWDSVASNDPTVFFKRWRRLAIVSDTADPLAEILESAGPVDEFDFELIMEVLSRSAEDQIEQLIKRLPWDRFTPDQIIGLYRDLPAYQLHFSDNVALTDLNTAELVDFMEILTPEAVARLEPLLEAEMRSKEFTLEDMELVESLGHKEAHKFLIAAGPPSDLDRQHIIREFSSSGAAARRVLLHSCQSADWYGDLIIEACAVDFEFLRVFLRGLSPSEVISFMDAALGDSAPVLTDGKAGRVEVKFDQSDLGRLFRSLSKTKQEAVIRHLRLKQGN